MDRQPGSRALNNPNAAAEAAFFCELRVRRNPSSTRGLQRMQRLHRLPCGIHVMDSEDVPSAFHG